MRKKILFCLAIIFSLLFGSLTAAKAEAERKKVTVMVYMCGSTLEMPPIYSEATSALRKIEASGFDPADVNIAALLGGTRAWAGGYDSSALTFLTFGETQTEELLPLAPMNDPRTLSAFLTECRGRFPAERYILIIWDHGGGPNMGVCQDDLFPKGGSGEPEKNLLSASDLAEAFRNSPFSEEKLDLLVFSCCLMSSAELGAVLSPYVKYLAATEDQMYGLSYDWLKDLEEDPDILRTAELLTDFSYQYNRQVIEKQHLSDINSFTVMDLEKTDALIEAMDDFFVYVSDQMDESAFTGLSDRRRETAAFGLSFYNENNFDLVDLGDFVRLNSDLAPSAAERLQAAIRDTVVYNLNSSGTCSGLTVYHPFLNKQRLRSWMTIHASIDFSRNYSSYLDHFASYLTGTPLAEWTGLKTDTADADKAVRTVFTLDLTGDQAGQYGRSELLALHKHENDTYTFLNAADTSFRETRISGSLSRKAVFIETKDGERLTRELEYSADEHGAYYVPALLSWNDAESGEARRIKALLVCRYEAAFHELIPEGIMIWEESLGTYRTVSEASPDHFSEVTFSTVFREETRDKNGTLLPFAEWKVSDTEERTFKTGDGWVIVLGEDSPPLEEVHAIFEITDSQNYRYCSDPLAVRRSDAGRNDDRSGTMIRYDDMDTASITLKKAVREADKLKITLGIENIGDREIVFGLESIGTPGVVSDREASTWGNGEHEGQEPGEEQDLSLSLRISDGSAADTIRKLSLVIYASDAVTQEVLASIPAEILF